MVKIIFMCVRNDWAKCWLNNIIIILTQFQVYSPHHLLLSTQLKCKFTTLLYLLILIGKNSHLDQNSNSDLLLHALMLFPTELPRQITRPSKNVWILVKVKISPHKVSNHDSSQSVWTPNFHFKSAKTLFVASTIPVFQMGVPISILQSVSRKQVYWIFVGYKNFYLNKKITWLQYIYNLFFNIVIIPLKAGGDPGY